MATYRQIQDYVRRHAGCGLKTCWIAHVKDDHGLTGRVAWNRGCDGERRHPCPAGKRAVIEAALRYFRMI